MNLQKNRSSWPGWYGWAAMLASSLVFALGAVWISLHAQAESERKLCSVVDAQGEAYRLTPPTTATGKKVAAAVDKLRTDLDCP